MDSLKMEATRAVRDYLRYKKIKQIEKDTWITMVCEIVEDPKFKTLDDLKPYLKTVEDMHTFLDFYNSEMDAWGLDREKKFDLIHIMNQCWSFIVQWNHVEESNILIKEIEHSTKN